MKPDASIADAVKLAGWAKRTQRSALQDLLVATAQPGIISFALGLPAPELFPVEACAEAAARVLASSGAALQYAPPAAALKARIVQLMARRGVRCREEQVFLTAGAQQGLSLALRVIVEPGDVVITETLTYPGFMQVLEPLGVRLVTVEVEPDTGLDPRALERVLRAQPPGCVIYGMPQGHNPLGYSLSVATRGALVDLAERYRAVILEDDAYGRLTYGDAAPALRASSETAVIYAGSFSKTLAPALRTGWLVAPESMIERLSVAKESADINMATLAQRIVVSMLDHMDYEAHVARLCAEYRRRRDAMVDALEQHLADEARWIVPTCGVFIWVELRRSIDTTALLRRAIDDEQVAFLPGAAFRAERGGGRATRCLRLNFSNCAPERIHDGIARLARVVRASSLPR
jgi:2-aminoadipate transaminase